MPQDAWKPHERPSKPKAELAREAVVWSYEAEQSLIGSVLNDNRAFDRAPVVCEVLRCEKPGHLGAILTLVIP